MLRHILRIGRQGAREARGSVGKKPGLLRRSGLRRPARCCALDVPQSGETDRHGRSPPIGNFPRRFGGPGCFACPEGDRRHDHLRFQPCTFRPLQQAFPFKSLKSFPMT